jgi:gluconolactonase
MEARRVAGGLRFPEGPTLLSDGRIAFVELYGGCISAWDPSTDRVEKIVDVGGVPNAAIVGPAGSLYVTQNGGKVGPWRAPTPRTPSIQMVREGLRVEEFVTEVDGIKLRAPNDLVFGRDGLLYFTDPAEGFTPDAPYAEGRVFVVDAAGHGHVIAETGRTFPNGIAAAADGAILWVESYTRAVKRFRGGVVETVAHVPDVSVPDGFKLDTEGNLYITGTKSGGLDVLSSDGTYRGFIACGAVPTNCLFVGSTLYVTDGGHTGLSADPALGVGGLWAIDMDVTGAVPYQMTTSAATV